MQIDNKDYIQSFVHLMDGKLQRAKNELYKVFTRRDDTKLVYLTESKLKSFHNKLISFTFCD